MTSDERNREAISEFSAPHIGKGLELYLKNKAWEDDSDGETCVYLVKDSENNIALFFSIKCGLLYEKTNYEKLEGDELEYVDMVIEAKLNDDEDAIQSTYDAGEYMFDEGVVDKLFRIADERISMKKEKARLKEKDSTLRAANCYSAIEMQHFCRNIAYQRTDGMDFPMGFGLFWEKIVPLLLEIVKHVGCKYIYLFAADNSDENTENKKLERYYKNDLLFKEISGVTIIKPDYDEDCRGLVQTIGELQKNAQVVWERFLE